MLLVIFGLHAIIVRRGLKRRTWQGKCVKRVPLEIVGVVSIGASARGPARGPRLALIAVSAWRNQLAGTVGFVRSRCVGCSYICLVS